MGKFSGVLLATDYDDTLYDSKGTISPENRAAIDRFLAEGGLFSISTGRSYINFVIQMEREKLPVNAPVILSNGASIYDFAKEESLWLKFLPKRAPVHIEDMPTPWLKVILQHPDTAVLQQAQEYLLSRWSDIYEATFSNRNLLEVTAKGANKGFSVLWLAQHLGVEQKDLYCIGNGLNDIPMLSVSAQSFAPANSYPEVREVADLVLPSCDESCVARMIEVLEERYKDR